MAKITHLPAQPFGDGVYRMELGPDQLRELETGLKLEKCGTCMVATKVNPHPKPIYETFAGLMSGRIETEGRTIGNAFQSGASMIDICNINRLGLIGGGMSDADAAKLVRENEPPHRPLNDLWEIAAALVYATLCGVEEDAPAPAPADG